MAPRVSSSPALFSSDLDVFVKVMDGHSSPMNTANLQPGFGTPK